MKRDRIDIRLTHGEARAQLQAAHAIDYRESTLGLYVAAHCTCGWTSPKVTAGFIAQAAADRHLAAFVEHPLENRARYAIYRGKGRIWILRDREGGADLGCSHHAEALEWIDVKLAREAAQR